MDRNKGACLFEDISKLLYVDMDLTQRLPVRARLAGQTATV